MNHEANSISCSTTKMAGLGGLLCAFSNLLRREAMIAAITIRKESTKVAVETIQAVSKTTPVTSGMNPDKWVNFRMLRDVKRRRLAKEHAPMRLRLISMKRNDILPPEIRELAGKDLDEIPRQAALRQLTPRCTITSRAYGTVHRWRLSRIVFRDLADYNKLSGVQRAIW